MLSNSIFYIVNSIENRYEGTLLSEEKKGFVTDSIYSVFEYVGRWMGSAPKQNTVFLFNAFYYITLGTETLANFITT
ncbi:MAG: hypothetical protein A2007_04265 [Verrucomicrobia bacterium GWC2_42_7]|nr:MAG: hypothetical protein A2007_04265 [Verrucomicrobia bacterium GWC2_42_7]